MLRGRPVISYLEGRVVDIDNVVHRIDKLGAVFRSNRISGYSIQISNADMDGRRAFIVRWPI